MRVLIVEDDAGLARGLVAALKSSGLAVDHEADGAEAARLALSEPYSLVVLDLGLPTLSGFQVLRRIREAGAAVPVMILTARDAVTDRVKGLDLGADDYVLKPFELAEFEARVRSLIRRGQGTPNPMLRCAALALDRATNTATLGDQPLALRRRELALLTALMTRAGKVVPRERLNAETFGFDEPVAPNALDLYIGRLRKKLQLAGGPEIHTIRGLGYLMKAE